MAIFSDMNGFPESGLPTLKNVYGRAKADSLVVTDINSIIAGNANNLGSVGKNNVFTNGAAGTNGFMAGIGNTLNLTGTADRGVAIGQACTATLATSQVVAVAVGAQCTASAQNTVSMGFNSTATINGAVSLGKQCTATNTDTVSIGSFNTCGSNGGVSIGSACVSNGGAFATTIGYGCGTAGNSGLQSVAVGFAATATAANSMIVGTAPSTYSVVNSTANSTMLAYEGTNFLLTDTKITANKKFLPVQATTAGAPAYEVGAIYFDTTLNKLRVGGAAGWETITSV